MARELKRKRIASSLATNRRAKQAQAQPRPPTPSDDNSEAGDFENLEQDNEFGAKEDAHVHTSSRIELSNSSEATRNGSTPPSAQENGGFSRFPPSGEELRAIKDASDLYKSNSFKLQVDALIPNIRPQATRTPPLERFLLALHTFLTTLPSVAPDHPLNASAKLLNQHDSKKKSSKTRTPVRVPYPTPQPSEGTNWKVAFAPPTDIFLIGSWATGVSVKRRNGKQFTIDLAVEMPSTLFQEKDYLDLRFFHKRAFYLACIASAIANSKNSELSVDVFYDSPTGNDRQATLLLHPRGDGSPTGFSKLQAAVRIVPVLAQDAPISVSHLSPAHSNIRLNLVDSKPSEPTPLYNIDLLRSVAAKQRLLSSYDAKNNVASFADGLALLRVWANQRGYVGSEGHAHHVHGFESRGHFWSALLELLVLGYEPVLPAVKGSQQRKPLGKGLSSYQLFRGALDFLARSDFASEDIFQKSPTGHKFTPSDYRTSHGAVFVDSSSLVNVLAGVPLASLDLLRYDAQVTLERLDHADISEDVFHDIFLLDQTRAFTRFDVVLCATLPFASSHQPLIKILDAGSSSEAQLNAVCACLRRGLGNRARAVAVTHRAHAPSGISTVNTTPSSLDIQIGLILDSEHASRLVDFGPPADEEASEETNRFREFWGEKAELRRFKDGRIMESVVWDVRNADERTHIPATIVQFLLQRHFGINSVTTWQADFDALLKFPKSISSMYQMNKITGGFKASIAAFDALVKTIKNLDKDLPLGVLAIHPASPYLRYTSAFNPVPIPTNMAGILPRCAAHLPAMDVVIEFEKSGRWPDELQAIQKIKLAFLDQVATALTAAQPGTSAVVAIDHTAGPIEDTARLEIRTSDGWAFSARIWHDREATLLDRIIDDHSYIKRQTPSSFLPATLKERRQAIAAREVHLRCYHHAPRHHRLIAALSHKYSAFSSTVRLVKRWFASHWLLDAHVSEEAVELLCARVFLVGGGPSAVPESKERGFSLVVAFLSNWEWENGLFIPVAKEGSTTAPISVDCQPSTSRAAWQLRTLLDPSGRMWTSNGPDAVIARRVRVLAQATYDCLPGLDNEAFDVKGLFTHPVDDYDVILHLQPAVLPRYAQNINTQENVWVTQSKYSNSRSGDTSASVKLVGFDPADLLRRDLQHIYADTLKLFHDPLGGDRFGVLWDPSVEKSRPFRVMGGYSNAPTTKSEQRSGKDGVNVILNKPAILAEMERLGSGLIDSIIVHD